MFKRTSLMAMLMLGLGAVLGYAAARSNLTISWGTAAEPVAAAAECNGACAVPDRNTVFTGFQGGGGAGKGGKGALTPGNPRGATTGPTDAPGYDHPNQYLHMKPTDIAPNMEPVIVHPKQVDEAKAK